MKIFESIKIGAKTAKNRIMMPPLVLFGTETRDGEIGEYRLGHYETRARDGIGTIVVEAAAVDPDYAITPNQIGIWHEKFLPGLSLLAERIKKHGALAVIQLQHAGGKPHESINKNPFGPSEADYAGHKMREASAAELQAVPGLFAVAAKIAERAGFDGVEIHNAHGYLLTQMVNPMINKRTDEYGGTPKKRMKLPLDVLAAIKAACSSGFLVGVRFGVNEPEYGDGVFIAQKYEENGIDYLSASHGYLFPGREEFSVPADFMNNAVVYGGKIIRENVKRTPVALVNMIKSIEEGEALLQKGCGDLIAYGRPLFAAEDFLARYKRGERENICLYCKNCAFARNHDVCAGRINEKKTR